jgi:hypothetical protein
MGKLYIVLLCMLGMNLIIQSVGMALVFHLQNEELARFEYSKLAPVISMQSLSWLLG